MNETVTALNSFDLCVIGVMALSCLFAFFRGLVREVLSLVAWIGAGIVTIHYFPIVAERMSGHFKSPAVAALAAMIGLYIVSLIAFSILNSIILKTIKGGSGGMLDNLLGLLFGAIRGALIISLGFFLLDATHTSEKEYPEWLKTSVTRPYGEEGAQVLTRIAPDYAEEIAKLEKKAEDKVKPAPPSDEAEPMNPEDEKDLKDFRTLNDRWTGRLGQQKE